MATLVFPSIVPDTLDFGIKYNTQISTTTLSGIIQTVELPGARWFGTMQFRDLNSAQSAELKAFLLKLRGSSGRFYFGDLELTSPQSTVSGTATIQSGSTARDIILSGHTGTFSVGDRIHVFNTGQTKREYKMIVDVTSPDTYTVEPMIRMPSSDFIGGEIVYTNPTGVFLLDSDDYAKWSLRSKALLSDMSFSFLEAFE